MCHHPVLLQFFCLGQPISTNRMRASEDTIFCVTASPSFRVPPPCMAALANPLSRSILLREPLNKRVDVLERLADGSAVDEN
jgi:hypothetical protein